jgi:hypothetical protein
MNDETHPYWHFRREGTLAAISAGFFFILVGTLFVIRPTLYDSLRTFFNPNEWTNHTFPKSNITLPVPKNLGDQTHVDIYDAALEFSLAWGIFQILILALRFAFSSSVRRKTRTVQSIVFWLGAAYLINAYLNATTTETRWFLFWAALIILIGLALIVRAIVLGVLRARRTVVLSFAVLTAPNTLNKFLNFNRNLLSSLQVP